MQEVECGVCGKKVDREQSDAADSWMLIDITINPQPWVRELRTPALIRRVRICSKPCATKLMGTAVGSFK